MGGIITSLDYFAEKTLPLNIARTTPFWRNVVGDASATLAGEKMTSWVEHPFFEKKSCLFLESTIGTNTTGYPFGGKLIFHTGDSNVFGYETLARYQNQGNRQLNWGIEGTSFVLYACHDWCANSSLVGCHYTQVLKVNLPTGARDNTGIKIVVNFKNDYENHPVRTWDSSSNTVTVEAFFVKIQAWVKFDGDDRGWVGGDEIEAPKENDGVYGEKILNYVNRADLGHCMIRSKWLQRKNAGLKGYFYFGSYWQDVTLHWASRLNVTNTECFDYIFSRRVYYDVSKIGE